ncbi:MAG: endolytic transglycosylase MltG [Proteobacteria bacterium]|nr:endolytic transglycosylase MltG [Pseudomonadota bacterium]
MRKVLAFLVVVAVIVAGAYFWEQWNYFAPGPVAANGATETVVLIKPGEGSAAIAQQLEQAGVVENGILFRTSLRLRNQQSALKAGEYAIPSRASMADIAGILIAGHSIQHKITAAEGLTSQMIYDIVKNDPVLVGDGGPVPQEGTLLPQTYLFTRGTTRAEILERMKKAQDALFEKMWALRDTNLPYRTRRQAVTLASIVEKETALADERRHVASVFANRLHVGMKLQSDPTIIYDVTKGYPLGRGIRESELKRASPHNTYVIDGLPPSPICNPGTDSIEAVLNPPKTDDLFFVATGQGGHVFASTISEHEKNVAKWRVVERGQKQPQTPSKAPPKTPSIKLPPAKHRR